MRWARTALCTLSSVALALLGTWGAAAPGAGAAAQGHSVVPASSGGPALTLLSQSPWVSPQQPWFNLAVGVNPAEGSAGDLHVDLTFYGRLDDSSQLQQSIGGTPPTGTLAHDNLVTVAAGGPTGLTASVCVTVLPQSSASTPATGAGACPAGAPILVLGCTPLTGRCGDVYPVGVALVRQGSAVPVAHFTTFLTYQEPGAIGAGGPLSVAVVLPVAGAGFDTVANALAAHHDVPTTLAVDPASVNAIEQGRTRDGGHALAQLQALPADEVVDDSYVPINLSALSEAGITGEITAQMLRGDQLLRAAGLKPAGGTWVDPFSNFTQGDAANLATGLQAAGASQLVLSDSDLATSGLNSSFTFAQPFGLDLGQGSPTTAAAVDTSLSARFSADPADPVLSAEQLLAGLSFVHFENAFLSNQRGIVLAPPAGWKPSAAFLDTLLGGLLPNQVLSPVTLAQFFQSVPVGGGPNDREPSVRHLQAGGATHGITHNAAVRIGLARQQLGSYADAVKPGHPPQLNSLGDGLLATEALGLSATRRAAALSAYDRSFAAATGKITLATERTVTFTAQQAAIPVTVLSASPYPVHVVVTLDSDKFTFPNGNTRTLLLDRPTTSVRVTAQARTSGDRLPIEVTLRTPDGQLLIAHTVLTVQSTAISFAGVALTALAGAVLLLWWVRTWLRSRRARARAR